ncbi:hypothetical protein N7522_004011 [Penicillium canescens]|nr:hypothetical protein N7522_004011 [Penicillium canescens]
MTASSATSLASTSKRIRIIKLADLNSNPLTNVNALITIQSCLMLERVRHARDSAQTYDSANIRQWLGVSR